MIWKRQLKKNILQLKEKDMINIDEDIENADWLKTTWDLPPYKSKEFNAIVRDLERFRKLPVYKHAVRKGLIKDDKWTGKKSI